MSKRYACASHIKKIYRHLDAAKMVITDDWEVEDWESCFYKEGQKDNYAVRRAIERICDSSEHLCKAKDAAFWLEMKLMEEK